MSNREDWMLAQNKNNTTQNKGEFSRNILRPVYADDSKNYDSVPVTKALTAASGISGTKSLHDSNAAFLATVKTEDKVGKHTRKFRNVKNNLGKIVRQGKPIIVKAKNIVKPNIKKAKNIKLSPQGSLERLLGGIS